MCNSRDFSFVIANQNQTERMKNVQSVNIHIINYETLRTQSNSFEYLQPVAITIVHRAQSDQTRSEDEEKYSYLLLNGLLFKTPKIWLLIFPKI